jgi:hypothetical protein
VNGGRLVLRGRPDRLGHLVRWDLKEKLACKGQRVPRALVEKQDRRGHLRRRVLRVIEAKRARKESPVNGGRLALRGRPDRLGHPVQWADQGILISGRSIRTARVPVAKQTRCWFQQSAKMEAVRRSCKMVE